MGFPRIRVAIDRGGTFTDVYAEIDRYVKSSVETSAYVFKLLSVDPGNYSDAPQEGIRRVLEMAGISQSREEKIDPSHIQWIRMGTTVATNALLERKGERCALATTYGLRDMLAIGHQARPSIFDLKVKKPSPLYEAVIEVQERVRVNRDANILGGTGFAERRESAGRKENSEPLLIVEQHVVEDNLRKDLKDLRKKGITSLAVALLHSYGFPDHEKLVGNLARETGFEHVSLSSQLTPMVKVVPRGVTATVDAYLSPKIKDYVSEFRSGFKGELKDVEVQFMQSDGGLCGIDNFCGYLAILSGPAGGVVGYGKTSLGCELACPSIPKNTTPKPVIGFDMGGTSTDVSRFSGSLSHIFETEIAGVAIQAPQLDISTVAAGGGSRLFYRSGMFHVGPESVGAHPGPVCYKKGGELAITDANLLLGRIIPEMFPKIFGPNADEAINVEATRRKFNELTQEINRYLVSNNEPTMTAEEAAEGFISVANEAMCRPIRRLTEEKGFDVREHTLACFGGAGGQHACAIARTLGIEHVFIHKYAGALSAYGIALADSVFETQLPLGISFNSEVGRKRALEMLIALRKNAIAALKVRGFSESLVEIEQYINLRYEGTDYGIMTKSNSAITESSSVDDILSIASLFESLYNREHGFSILGRDIIIDDVRVRGRGLATTVKSGNAATVAPISTDTLTQCSPPKIQPNMISKTYFSSAGGWCDTPVYRRADLKNGTAVIQGPSIVIDETAGVTVVVDIGCTARITSDGNILLNVPLSSKALESTGLATAATQDSREMDPVRLSVYAHRFMGIAEQMGRTLQRTAISTNIKERLDFSCAIFDETGGLVANAPHVPVHLGAMQDAVRYQIRKLGSSWKDGDVILSNHPCAGGTHLPDITIITPVFFENKIVFFVASRGHHADIGGTTPGSMPPFSKRLEEEGLAIESMKIVKDKKFQESDLVNALQKAGCRCVSDVMSDIRAQVAANKRGIILVSDLIQLNGLENVQAYMHRIQRAAAQAVRDMLRRICKLHSISKEKALHFRDKMDDGTVIDLNLKIDYDAGTAKFDFRGTGAQVDGNTNAPCAITTSAIIYALRCLVDIDIPLNQGCLDPITIVLPDCSLLSPDVSAAVVGGNVLTSQRVTDVVLGAFGACSASQGCMNNFLFGDDSMGYYETIAGGCGAGPGWNGTSGVQTHMTNTRMTDPEILERRFPAVVRCFSYREGSGGKGKWIGGDGIIREIEFTKPVVVSILSERRESNPWGLHGGLNGARGINEYIPKGSLQGTVLRGKSCTEVHAGDRIRIQTPGGGGYGTFSRQNHNSTSWQTTTK